MLSRVPAVLSLVLLPTLCSASRSSQGQVYLNPPLAYSSYSSDSNNALLAHHLGLEAFEPLPQDGGEVVLGGARPFVGQDARDALLISVDANHPEDIIPATLPPSFALPAPPRSIIDRYSRLAPTSYSSVTEPSSQRSAPPTLARLLDIFSLSASSSEKSRAAEKFMGGLSALVAFVEESQAQTAGERFGAFGLEGLRDMEESWGRESELYVTAAATLKATIHSAISSDLLSLAVLSSPSPLHARQIAQPPQTPLPGPSVPDTAPIFSTSTCFTTASACANATASCSSRGQCVGVTRAGRTCFVCECGKAPLEEGGKNVTWAGSMCQKKDLSQQFTLIVGTVIFLILMSVGSITLLYSIGDQELPGTLTGGVGHMKHE